MKKNLKIFLAPAAVLLILSVVYCTAGLFPFGEKTAAWGDMKQQVLPLLLQLKQILRGGDSILYSQMTGGGMGFFSVFLFFLSNPFSFLAVLVPETELIGWINIIIALQMACCALTAQCYFQTVWGKLTFHWQTLLSISYAMSGYAMLYYQNLVWLTTMALFPLLLLSLHSMQHRGRVLPYVVVLTLTLYTQLYLSYMVILFLILFLSVCLFVMPKEHRGGFAAKAGIGTTAAGLLSAPAWMCFWEQYQVSARGVSLFDSLSKCRLLTDWSTMLPVLTCTAVVAAALLFFPWRTKSPVKACPIVFLLIFIPFMLEPVNRMWHTGSYQAFPARYGYILVMLGLIAAAQVLGGMPDPEPAKSQHRPLVRVWLGIGVFAVVVLSFLLFRPKALKDYTQSLWVSNEEYFYLFLVFLCAFVCFELLFYYFRVQAISRCVFSAGLCILILGGSLFHGDVFIGTAANTANGWKDTVSLTGKMKDDGFYRVKNHARYFEPNLLGGLGYPTLNHYTSLTPQCYMDTMKQLGYSSRWMDVNSCGGTSLTDALLCNRYTLYQNSGPEMGKISANQIAAQSESYTIAENSHTLPLGLVVSGGAIEEDLPESERSEIQQYLYETLLEGDGQLVTRYEPTEWMGAETGTENGKHVIRLESGETAGLLSYSIPLERTQALYLDCFDELTTALKTKIDDAFQVTVNGELVKQAYPDSKMNGLLYLGKFRPGIYNIKLSVKQDVQAKSFSVFGLDSEYLRQALQRAQTAELSVRGANISGTCTAEDGGSLFLSVPYDKGFSAEVNGKAVPVERVCGTFMAVRLEKGENMIALRYTPRGWGMGWCLFAAGAVMLALSLLFLRRIEKARPFGTFCTGAIWFLGGLVIAVVYVFPLLVWAVC